MRTHRLARFGRQPPPAQVPQGAAEGAAGRLGLRLGGLVVDGAVLHGRAGCRLAVKRKQKGGGGRGGEGEGEGEGPPGPGRTKALPAAGAIAHPGGERERRPRAVRGEGAASGLGLFSGFVRGAY